MSLNFQNVLKANIVLLGVQLLQTREEKDAFANVVRTEVVEIPPTGIMGSIPGSILPSSLSPQLSSILRLDRDRINLETLPIRSTIGREFPTLAELDWLAEVSRHAIDHSSIHGQQLQAYGFNVDAVYELTAGQTSSQFMASHIYCQDLFQSAGFQFVSGSSKLAFLKGDQVWNIIVEPRLVDPNSDKVFMSFNLHLDSSEMPTTETISQSLREVWLQASAITESLDGSA